MSMPQGHGMQYLQSVQLTMGNSIICTAISSINSSSSSDRGWKWVNVFTLSSSGSMLVIPERVHSTRGCEPQKRKAQEAMLLSGSRCFIWRAMPSGTLARRPPSRGSIITIGMLRLSSSSYRYEALAFRTPSAWFQST